MQGLSKTKSKEVEEMVTDNSIVCLTETQKKIRDVNVKGEILVVENMRERQDQKGGD